MTAQELLKVRKPTYRLFMPSVQLGAMTQLWGDLKVEYAYGRGSFSLPSTTVSLTYGRLVNTPQSTGYLDYKCISGFQPKISDIYNDFRERGVPDISVDRLGYSRIATVGGTKMQLLLKFGKETVHPQDYGKLVVDGLIPKQEMYETVKQTKTIMLERGVSPDTVKRIRYSGLVLHEIEPHKELIYDAYAMIALLEPNMMFMQEIYKRWTLYDYEFRRKPNS
jgi:hypothetical protein